MTGRLGATLVSLLVVGSVALPGCGGDGRPGFCDDLAKNADLGALTKALDGQDLAAARRAAAEFEDLADGAPAPIRDDLEDLAHAVSDIVGLLTAERASGPSTGGTATSTTAPGTAPTTGAPSSTDGTSATPSTDDPAAVEQRRESLNRRLADLSATSSRVEDWATHTCGISLT
jgi:hypothetical protein